MKYKYVIIYDKNNWFVDGRLVLPEDTFTDGLIKYRVTPSKRSIYFYQDERSEENPDEDLRFSCSINRDGKFKSRLSKGERNILHQKITFIDIHNEFTLNINIDDVKFKNSYSFIREESFMKLMNEINIRRVVSNPNKNKRDNTFIENGDTWIIFCGNDDVLCKFPKDVKSERTGNLLRIEFTNNEIRWAIVNNSLYLSKGFKLDKGLVNEIDKIKYEVNL